MNLKQGSILYARIDYTADLSEMTDQDAMDSMAYNSGLAKERYLVAGIFGNMEQGEITGAMALFEAKDLEEAKSISDNDPIIKRGFYRYEIHKWNVMLAPEQ